jgi:hypothetical protein
MSDTNSPTPSIPAETAQPAPSTPMKTALSASEAAMMAGWIKADLASGKMTQAQADRAFADLNTPLEQRGPDLRSEEAKELDKHFPAAKENDYTIRYGVPGQEPMMTPELKQFDANSRSWMSTAGMPKNIGDSLVTQIGRVMQETQHMSEAELEMYGAREYDKLERTHGTKLEERLQAAALMIDQLERTQPGLKNLLKSKGIGDNALVANMLMQHAQIFHAKKTGTLIGI